MASMKQKSGVGCMIGTALLAIIGTLFVKSEAGKWIFGLLFVYGGTIAAQNHLFEVKEGTVISIKRVSANGQNILIAPVDVEYIDQNGELRRARGYVPEQTSPYRDLQQGQVIKILVCRTDPALARIGGQPELGPKKCKAKEDQ